MNHVAIGIPNTVEASETMYEASKITSSVLFEALLSQLNLELETHQVPVREAQSVVRAACVANKENIVGILDKDKRVCC